MQICILFTLEKMYHTLYRETRSGIQRLLVAMLVNSLVRRSFVVSLPQRINRR